MSSLVATASVTDGAIIPLQTHTYTQTIGAPIYPCFWCLCVCAPNPSYFLYSFWGVCTTLSICRAIYVSG
jgi:hypothetical protein